MVSPFQRGQFNRQSSGIVPISRGGFDERSGFRGQGSSQQLDKSIMPVRPDFGGQKIPNMQTMTGQNQIPTPTNPNQQGQQFPQQGQLPQQPLPQQQVQQQFGLSGFEQAQQAGLQGGLSALSQGTGGALNTLQFGNQLAQQQLGQGQQALGGDFSAQAQQVDPITGQPLFQQAAGGVGAFSGAGLQAQGLQSALTGAQGQEAFNQALIDNPQQDFLNRRGQEALANQAAASGGLGSGQFQAELQQLGQAQAGQQVQQQIQNLSALSGQGLQAAAQQGQFLSQAGQQQGQLAGQNAALGTQANLSSAANRLNAAGRQANLFGQGAGISSALAGQGAGFQQQGGLQASNLFSGAGNQIGQGRLQAGRDIANQIAGTTNQLSQLSNQQGTGLSDIIGTGGSNLANLLSGFGQSSAAQNEGLARLLANLSIGQGTQQAGFAQQAGNALANADLAAAQGQQELAGTVVGALASFSDERLKENITNIGSFNGVNFYNWSWNDKMPDKSLIGTESSGVLAQELESIYPELVIEDESGFKKVNYIGLGAKLWQ